MKHLPIYLLKGCACALSLTALVILGYGCKGGTIPGSSNAAPHLEERDPQGNYSPYFQTADMNQPRYFHQAIRLKNGLVLVSGGTDERGFSAFETAEIFDESGVAKGQLVPESKSGVWIDTDFEGNPIVMEFRRLWHTMTMLPDNRIIIIGGAANFLKARPVEKVEIFDPDKRMFETLKDAKLLVPRVRHTATVQRSGDILIAGGQFHDIYTNIQTGQQQGGWGSGTIQVTTQTDIFPSTNRVELFNFREMEFTELTITESSRISTLSSSRGRSGHTTGIFAGPDNRLNTGDDLTLVAGGFQTASTATGDLVPQVMVPRVAGTSALRTLEIYDPTIRVFSQIGTVLLNNTRVNDPQLTNLGIFNERTPDDVLGLGNVILVGLGDNNATDCHTTTFPEELFSASYSGFGPAQGLVFRRITYNGLEDGHLQTIEWDTADPMNPGLPGRSMTNIVVLPRTVESRPGTLTTGTWIFTGAGLASVLTPLGCFYWFEGSIASGVIFDPFYNLIAASQYTLEPVPNARSMDTEYRNETSHPTGVIGCWLGMDGKLPSTSRIGFGDTEQAQWAHNKADRVYGQLLAIAGEDGIINTPDDRVLFTGGGTDGFSYGGEISLPSTELVLIPKSPP